VFSTEVQQLLNVKDVAGAGIGTGLEYQGNKFSHVLVWKHLDYLEGGVRKALLTQEKQSQAQGENPGETVLQVFFFFF